MSEPERIVEECATSHEEIASSCHNSRSRCGTDATINLDVHIEATFQNPPTDLCHLGLCGGYIGLAPKAWVHRHHENQVDEIKDMLNRLGGVAGLITTAGEAPSSRIAPRVRCRCVQVSACTITIWHPAST